MSTRLSFVTPQDQQQFQQLFSSALRPGETAMDGETARMVLMRSQLPTQTLGEIWHLSDTTRSGTLLFPEFCLAMSLCGSVRRGEQLPRELHPGLLKEIGDMVDQINFSIPDSQPNEFDRLAAATAYQQPAGYQGMGYQSTNPIQAQTTGYFQGNQGFQNLQAQNTGYLQSQNTGNYQPQSFQPQTTGYQPQTGFQSQGGFQPQTTGFQPQTTGYLQSQNTGNTGYLQSQNTGNTGYQSQNTGTGFQSQNTGAGYLQSQNTGNLNQTGTGYLQSQNTGNLTQTGTGYLQSQNTGNTGTYQPLLSQSTGYLQSQPTGKPGQWGFSNQATPGIENFVGAFTTGAQPAQANNTIGTAISKTEKQKFDQIFAEWDPQRSGYITGSVAIQNFSKSGLPQADLERIWALSDPTDRGKLNPDEFAVAMHLIYRRLNGYEIPAQLPPELLPPSSRHIQDSLNQVKQFLKNTPTGSTDKVSYLKSNSFDAPKTAKKDATVFKNDDSAAASNYKSANRYKAGPKPTKPASMQANTLSELAKAISEKKVILEALDAEDEDDKVAQASIERDNAKAIQDLEMKIRNVQRDLDSKQPKQAPTINKRELQHKFDGLFDALPQLTMSIRKVEQDIAVARVELVRKKYEKENPGFQIAGTGPNGEITENDRASARRKAELRARMSAITGRQLDGANSYEQFEKVLVEASQAAAQVRETNEQSLRALEESVRGVKRDLDSQLRESAAGLKQDRDRARWEEAVGVEPQVKDLIMSLKPQAQTPQQSVSGNPTGSQAGSQTGSQTGSRTDLTDDLSGNPPVIGANSVPPAHLIPPHLRETPQERVARIRAEAERRTRERFAKAGIQMRGKRDSGTPEPKPKPEPKEEPKPVEEPKPEPKEAPKPKPVPVPVPVPVEDSDDEESARLQKENDEMRERLRLREEEAKQRKAAKAKEKEERLAALKRQQEEMKKLEASLADSDSDDEPTKPVSTNPFGKAPVAKEQPTQPTQPAQPKKEPQFKPPQPKAEPQRASPAQPEAPKAKQLPTAVPRPPQAAARTAPNPFGPRPTAKSDDDDWGSDNNDDSDDEGHGRAHAAQLASMLFGSMGGAPRRTESPETTRSPVTTAAPQPLVPQAVTPQAPTAPELSFSAPPAPQEPIAAPPQAPSPPGEPSFAPPPPKSLGIPSHTHNDDEDDFVSAAEDFTEPGSAPPASPMAHTPEPFDAPPAPPSAPPAPPSAPPAPPSAPPAPPSAPPAPPSAPPAPPSAPPAPPSAPPAPPSAPSAPPSAPPAPPSAPPAPPSAPPAPPSAPPAPPSAPPAPPSAPPASAPGLPMGGMAALLGDITKGKQLRKVDPSQQKISGSELGRVL